MFTPDNRPEESLLIRDLFLRKCHEAELEPEAKRNNVQGNLVPCWLEMTHELRGDERPRGDGCNLQLTPTTGSSPRR